MVVCHSKMFDVIVVTKQKLQPHQQEFSAAGVTPVDGITAVDPAL